MHADDLNLLEIITNGSENQPLVDLSESAQDCSVQVYFRDLEDHLIAHISTAQVVVGGVAWFTSHRVIRALCEIHGVSLIVNKEDFLRPDAEPVSQMAADLRNLYTALPYLPERHLLRGLVGSLSVCSDPIIDCVRCLGTVDRQRKTNRPRMHNKFFVFCGIEPGTDGYEHILPRSVWTGSFNPTTNGSKSLENAVVITHPIIADAYYREWEQLLALSEPLDWDCEWVCPEYRIGS